MNPKIFVGVAVAALMAILGGILLVGPTVEVVSSENSEATAAVIQTKPIEIELGDIEVTKISERNATIELSFVISNPNQRSIIVQIMDYQLFETGYSQTEQIAGGSIGTRAEGMVEFGNNFYTLLGDNSIILKDKIILKNTGNTPELWSGLEDGSSTWKVSGVVFYNLSSMTSGQENELYFEFTQ